MSMRYGISRSASFTTCVLIIIIVLSPVIGAFSVLQISRSIPTSGSVTYGSTPLPFEDGFESGDFSAWKSTVITSGDTASVTNTMPHHGSYGAKFTSNGDAIYEAAYSYLVTPQSSELYARGYVKVSQIGFASDGDRLFLIRFGASENGVAFAGWRQVSGQLLWNLIIRDGTTWVTAYSTTIPSVDLWYSVELHWVEDVTNGYAELYVDGTIAVSISNKNTAAFGNINEVRFGLAEGYNSGSVTIYGDCFEVSKTYIGLEPTSNIWAIIGSKDKIPAMKNVFWLFGNQSISYTPLNPSQVVNYETIKNYAGLVVWTTIDSVYNFSAVRLFAKTKPVISHILDFSFYLYPALKVNTRIVSTNIVTYAKDWGNFRSGDKAEMHNGTGYLTTVASSDLTTFANITTIARVSSTRTALFQMTGSRTDSGFYVMDLSATRPSSFEPGNWHLFPAIAKASPVSVGRFGRWMTDGLSWRSLEWINSWMTNFTSANSDIVTMRQIGKSVLGRAINALFIGKGTRYFIADGAIHGDEKSGSFGLIRFAELVVEWYRTSQSWQGKLTQYKIILIPVLNPDGYVANTRENGRGRDTNRNFPPGATTTEPEAWALRWLMGNYTPTQYATLHADGPSYPMYVFYAGLSVEPYRTYVKLAVSEGNVTFSGLKHWGTIYDGDSVGKYNYIGPSGSQSMSNEYAYYAHRAVSILVEHPSQNRPGANMHGQEFYITALLSLFLHHDRTSGFMVQSNAFVVEATYSTPVALYISIDTTYLAGDRLSNTKILDFNGRGKPTLVYIDDVLRTEGDKWSWDSSKNTTTITGALETVLLQW